MGTRSITPLIAGLLAVLAGGAVAETSSDFRVGTDRATFIGVDKDNKFALDDKVYSSNLEYVKSLLDNGYPMASVILHLTSRGMTVRDTAYYLALANPERAEEVLTVLNELLPALPSWVCDESLKLVYARENVFDLAELGATPSIRGVAARYFSSGEQIRYGTASFASWQSPDWTKGEYHMMASVDELIELAKDEPENPQQGGAPDTWWYVNGQTDDSATPVLVSLYAKGLAIAIDRPLSSLEAAKQSGKTQLPVIFIYNDREFIATSRLLYDTRSPNRDIAEFQKFQSPDEDGRVTVGKVARAYFFFGERLTPTREWHYLDRHIDAQTDELARLVKLPTKEEVGAKKWSDIEQTLRSKGFDKPLIITLYDARRDIWLDDPAMAAVASGMGKQTVPVAFLYHSFGRNVCGLPCFVPHTTPVVPPPIQKSDS